MATTTTTTTGKTLREIWRSGTRRAMILGHAWDLEPTLTPGRMILTRDVKVKGRLELGGFTANHWRCVRIYRPDDLVAPEAPLPAWRKS